MIVNLLYFEHILPTMKLEKILFKDENIIPIIWNNQGKYRIIPTALIRNLINMRTWDFIIINWYEALDLDERTAKLLLDQ